MKLYKSLIALAVMGMAGSAMASENCTINIKGDDRMQFDLKEATVSASCPEVIINLEHTGKLPVAAMGHNVVVSKTSDVADLAKDAIKAGAASGYLPEGDARVIGATDMIGGGESSKATLSGSKLNAGEDYTFFCSFPGHSSMMKGTLKVVK